MLLSVYCRLLVSVPQVPLLSAMHALKGFCCQALALMLSCSLMLRATCLLNQESSLCILL